MHDVAQLELDDASTFQEASQEALQSRRIVKARRNKKGGKPKAVLPAGAAAAATAEMLPLGATPDVQPDADRERSVALKLEGNRLLAAGDLEGARQKYEKSLAHDDRNVASWTNLRRSACDLTVRSTGRGLIRQPQKPSRLTSTMSRRATGAAWPAPSWRAAGARWAWPLASVIWSRRLTLSPGTLKSVLSSSACNLCTSRQIRKRRGFYLNVAGGRTCWAPFLMCVTRSTGASPTSTASSLTSSTFTRRAQTDRYLR